MDLDRAHTADAPDIGTRPSSARLIPAEMPSNRPQDDGDHPEPIPPATSTQVLRRCTALATRARVELLTTSRHAAADELTEVLDELASWHLEAVVDPDPTMLALAAAALQDLRERMPGTDTSTALADQVQDVLDLLHRLMSSTGPVAALA